MIVYGASGHGKVIIDIIHSINSESIDFIIDDNSEINELQEYEVNHKFTEEMADKKVVLAIGNNKIRKDLSESLDREFCEPIIHPSSVIAEFVEIGRGTVLMANSILNPSVTIGKHCIINTGAIVEHDVKLKDYVHISPGSIITGNVHIGEGTHIGAGATVIPGIKIGKWVTVGAGSVIINDIPDYSVVVGNPGKVIKFNKIGNE